eukprot:8288290-Lingulodinium_polyedra.AAC.1
MSAGAAASSGQEAPPVQHDESMNEDGNGESEAKRARTIGGLEVSALEDDKGLDGWVFGKEATDHEQFEVVLAPVLEGDVQGPLDPVPEEGPILGTKSGEELDREMVRRGRAKELEHM